MHKNLGMLVVPCLLLSVSIVSVVLSIASAHRVMFKNSWSQTLYCLHVLLTLKYSQSVLQYAQQLMSVVTQFSGSSLTSVANWPATKCGRWLEYKFGGVLTRYQTKSDMANLKSPCLRPWFTNNQESRRLIRKTLHLKMRPPTPKSWTTTESPMAKSTRWTY
jgi:hypothetical protein